MAPIFCASNFGLDRITYVVWRLNDGMAQSLHTKCDALDLGHARSTRPRARRAIATPCHIRVFCSPRLAIQNCFAIQWPQADVRLPSASPELATDSLPFSVEMFRSRLTLKRNQWKSYKQNLSKVSHSVSLKWQNSRDGHRRIQLDLEETELSEPAKGRR
jgi:hypothetical protein